MTSASRESVCFSFCYSKNDQLKNRVDILKGKQANYISQHRPLQVKAFRVLMFDDK